MWLIGTEKSFKGDASTMLFLHLGVAYMTVFNLC